MATISPADPRLPPALNTCASALRRMASYQLDPLLDQRMRDLGERKEFLNQEEHDVLLALVAFSQQRSIEKLEAELALRRLEEVFPELAEAS